MGAALRGAQWRWTMALCAVAAGAWPAPARAEIQVPEGCGGEAELRSELVRLLGEERASEAWPDRLRIEVDSAGGYALELSIKGEARRVSDADCQALFKSAVVMAAVAVDPTAAERSKKTEAEPEPANDSPEPEPEPEAKPEPEPEAEPEPEPEAEPEPDTGPVPLRLSVSLGGGAVLGIQPDLAPTAELALAFMGGPLGLALAGRYLFESDASRGGRAVDIDGFGGRLVALYEPLQVLRFAAGVGLDQLSGRGAGTGVTGNANSGTRVAFVLEAEVRPLTFGQLWVSAALSAEFAVARPDFQITGYGSVYRVPEWAGSLLLRVGWEFL